jgi:predicted glycosyltransferase
MNIVIDINHPAHVHFFKYFIPLMESKGHKIMITATLKEINLKLLNIYKLQYKNLGSYGESIYTKLVNLPLIDYKMYNEVKDFKPDIFMGIGSIRAAHIARILNKPSITFEDTEVSKEQRLLYFPFTTNVFTPQSFILNLGKKQIRYPSYHQLAYLHPKWYTPNQSILDEVNLNKNDKFIIMRLVAWTATHDIGHIGIRDVASSIKRLENYGKIFITSEKPLKGELEQYRLNISPEKLHDLLSYASLYYGDGQSTASEAATLGTHAILIDPTAKDIGMSYHMRKYNLLNFYENEEKSFQKTEELLTRPNLKSINKEKQSNILKENMDLTSFNIWLVENYPDSINSIKDSNIYNKFIYLK